MDKSHVNLRAAAADSAPTCRMDALTMRTESQDYKGYEIQVVHTPPKWQANIYPKPPQVSPVNRALLPISCQIKGDAFAKARERIDDVLKAVAHKIPVAFGP